MLNSHTSPAPVFRHRFSPYDGQFNPTVAMERQRRHDEAERLAGVGLFEIAVGVNGEHESQHWSAGIYSILRRDPRAPPLQRNAYVLQYVHPDDQQRVFRLSRDALENGRSVAMTYRIVCDDGGVAQVSERLAVVTTTTTERLLFADMNEMPPPTTAVSTQVEKPLDLPRIVAPAADGQPGIEALLATFDALREREQQRLAREMHDDFGQLLLAMKIDLCMLRKKLTRGDPTTWSEVENLQELVDAMIASTRRIIAELPPKAVDELGLFPAIEQLVAGHRKRQPFQLTLRLVPPQTRADPRVELAVYRVLQEALNNVVRHAGATRVDISVECNATHLMLHIRDNGKGISTTDFGKDGSFGLMWMRERVLALAGTFDLDRVDGQGTSIIICLPMQHASSAGST